MNEIKEILDTLKNSVDNPIIDVPTYDGSDSEPMDNIALLKPNACKQLLDYITNLQQLYENGLKVNQNSHKYITELEMNNAILKEDLDKANDIIEKDRQFYKCRMNEYVELKKENERLKGKINNLEMFKYNIPNDKTKIVPTITKSYKNEYEDYKSRCEGTINLIDRTIEIIKQQPTKDDNWILSRLYGFKYALIGSDEK